MRTRAQMRKGAEGIVNSCETTSTVGGATFEELQQEMQSDLYWVRFFARPCCPAPDAEGATKMLARLKREVDARDDFSDAEKEALCAIIDERDAWYPTSGLCKRQ